MCFNVNTHKYKPCVSLGKTEMKVEWIKCINDNSGKFSRHFLKLTTVSGQLCVNTVMLLGVLEEKKCIRGQDRPRVSD